MNSEIIDPDTNGNFISKDILTNPGLHSELLLLSLHPAHKERAKAEKQSYEEVHHSKQHIEPWSSWATAAEDHTHVS